MVEVGVGGVDGQCAAGGHRIARVDGEIDQDLFDLTGIGAHRPQVRVQAGGQVDVLAEDPAQHLFDITDDLVEVQHLRLGDFTSAEGEQLFGEPGGTLGGSADLGKVGTGGGQILRRRGAGVEGVGEPFGVVGDLRQY